MMSILQGIGKVKQRENAKRKGKQPQQSYVIQILPRENWFFSIGTVSTTNAKFIKSIKLKSINKCLEIDTLSSFAHKNVSVPLSF